jgi:hypothetical protein
VRKYSFRGVQASGLRTRVVVRHSTGSQTINVESFLLLPRRWHGEQEAARARNMCWYSTSIFKSASSAEVRKVSVLRLYRLHYYLAYDSVSSTFSYERRLKICLWRYLCIHWLQIRYAIPSSRFPFLGIMFRVLAHCFIVPDGRSNYHTCTPKREFNKEKKKKRYYGYHSRKTTRVYKSPFHKIHHQSHRLFPPNKSPIFPIVLNRLPPSVGLLSNSLSFAYLLSYSLSVSGSNSP